jgi:hypothetical protein
MLSSWIIFYASHPPIDPNRIATYCNFQVKLLWSLITAASHVFSFDQDDYKAVRSKTFEYKLARKMIIAN